MGVDEVNDWRTVDERRLLAEYHAQDTGRGDDPTVDTVVR
jgi:hypothetical protein